METKKKYSSKKQVKKPSENKNFYFSIVQGIKEGKSIVDISYSLGVSKQRLNYYISSLKRNGFINKIGYGTWEVLKPFEIEQVKKIKCGNNSKPDKIRGHGFQFTLKIPRLPNWNRREEYLYKNNINYIKIGSNWKGQRIIIRGHKIWLTPISIIVFSPKFKSYFAETSKVSKNHAIYEFKQIITSLEGILKVNLMINKKYVFKVSRQHYGIVKNALAQQYDKEGKKLACYTENGLWMVIDNSYNLHELETLHPKTADDDNLTVQKFFNSLKENPITPKFILDMFNGLVEDRKFWAEHQKSHIAAIQELSRGVNKFNDKLDELLVFVKNNKK